MNNEEVSKKYYMSEFELFDGEYFIIFNIIDVDMDKQRIRVAVSNTGKISVIEFDLKLDYNGQLYFEYGVMCERVVLDDFEEVA